MAEVLSKNQVESLLEACGYNDYVRKQREQQAELRELATRASRLAVSLRDGDFIHEGDSVVGKRDATPKEQAAAQIIEELLECLGIDLKE